MKKYLIIISFLFLSSCTFFEKQKENKESIIPIKKEILVNTGNIIPKVLLDTGTIFETGVLLNTGGVLNSKTGIIYNSGITNKNELHSFNSGIVNNSYIIKKDYVINKIIDTDDSSIKKYINDKIHYSKINYKPNDLVRINGDFIIDTKGNQILRFEANKNLQLLSKDFFDNFNVKLEVVSAYRSYYYQVGIKRRGCSDLFCAKAGYSEHQSGLAIDLFETTSQKEFLSKPELKKYFIWLNENAYKYGFNNSYKNGKVIDGYAIEPWHWRYLGKEFAKELYEKNMTYGQYYKKYGEKK